MHRRYDFIPVTEADKPLLYAWLEHPHVACWWCGDEDPFEEEIPEGGDIRKWIVQLGREPIAYVQDYLVHAWEDHPFAFLKPGARAIDMFIGPADKVECGHGTAIIKQHLVRLISEGAPQVGIDPHPDNGRAIRAYEKAGFVVIGPARDGGWGLYVPMVFTGAGISGAPR